MVISLRSNPCSTSGPIRQRGAARRASGPSRGARLRPGVERLDARCLLSAGALDTTFNSPAGYLTRDFGNSSWGSQTRAVVIQPWDGKIVVGSAIQTTKNGMDFALARYNPNGTLDSTFGTNGLATVDFSGGGDQLQGLAIVPGTHKILATGKVWVSAAGNSAGAGVFGLARTNENGSLDTTFGSKGIASYTLWKDSYVAEYPQAANFDSLGRVVLAGSGTNQSAKGAVYTYNALIRCNSNGSLDTGFGNKGVVLGPQASGGDGWRSLMIQADNSITVLGNNNRQTVVARFTVSGALATSNLQAVPPGLGTGGVFQADGRIINAQATSGIVGTAWTTADSVSLFRNNANGSLDGTFAQGNVSATTDLSAYFAGHLGSYPELVSSYGGTTVPTGHTLFCSLGFGSVGFDKLGRIVVSGSVAVYDANGTDPVTEDRTLIQTYGLLLRYSPDGVLDTAGFGIDGVSATAFRSGPYDQGLGPFAVQADGKIVAGGILDVGTGVNRYGGHVTNLNVLVARFLGDSPSGQQGATTAIAQSSSLSAPLGVAKMIGPGTTLVPLVLDALGFEGSELQIRVPGKRPRNT